MNTTLPEMHQRVVVDREHLQDLFMALTSKGYQVVGPTVRDHAIVYDTLSSVTDLPDRLYRRTGWRHVSPQKTR